MSAKPERNASKTVWFGNYSAWMTDGVLRELLPDAHFLELRLVHGAGGRLMSYCFLEFSSCKIASAAIKTYHGRVIEIRARDVPREHMGKRIRLKMNFASTPSAFQQQQQQQHQQRRRQQQRQQSSVSGPGQTPAPPQPSLTPNLPCVSGFTTSGPVNADVSVQVHMPPVPATWNSPGQLSVSPSNTLPSPGAPASSASYGWPVAIQALPSAGPYTHSSSSFASVAYSYAQLAHPLAPTPGPWPMQNVFGDDVAVRCHSAGAASPPPGRPFEHGASVDEGGFVGVHNSSTATPAGPLDWVPNCDEGARHRRHARSRSDLSIGVAYAFG